jgi:hypothetical protein
MFQQAFFHVRKMGSTVENPEVLVTGGEFTGHHLEAALVAVADDHAIARKGGDLVVALSQSMDDFEFQEVGVAGQQGPDDLEGVRPLGCIGRLIGRLEKEAEQRFVALVLQAVELPEREVRMDEVLRVVVDGVALAGEVERAGHHVVELAQTG